MGLAIPFTPYSIDNISFAIGLGTFRKIVTIIIVTSIRERIALTRYSIVYLFGLGIFR